MPEFYSQFKAFPEIAVPTWVFDELGLEDNSWGNDAMGHADYRWPSDPNGRWALELWIDYEFPQDREDPSNPRFSIDVVDRARGADVNTSVTLFQTEKEDVAHRFMKMLVEFFDEAFDQSLGKVAV